MRKHSPEYAISGPTDHIEPVVIHINTDDDYTPAQAFVFALKILKSAEPYVEIKTRHVARGTRS